MQYHKSSIKENENQKKNIVFMTPARREQIQRDIEECKSDITDRHKDLKMRIFNTIGKDKKSLSRNTIEEWDIKVTDIDDSKEQPLTLDIVKREEDKE